MPKIPQYDRQVGLTTQAPGVELQAPKVDNPYATATQELGKSFVKTGEVIFVIEEAIKEAKRAEEKGQATIKSTKMQGELINEAEQDTDVINFDEKYTKKIADVRNASSALVKDPEARTTFTRQLDLDLVNTGFKIKKIGYTKLIDQRKATLAEETTTLQNSYLNETDPNIRQQYLKKIESGFTTAAGQGVITREDAYKSFEKVKAELPEKQATWDIMGNPVYALGELQKGNEGAYKDLPIDKRATLIKQADERIEKLKKQEEQVIAIATNKKEADLIDLDIAGQLDENIVLQERQLGNISATFADAKIQNLRKPKIYKPNALESITKFNELVERNTDLAKKENWLLGAGKAGFDEITKFRADTIDANTKGFISDKQMTDLLATTSKTFYRDPVFQNTLEQLAAQSTLYATPEAKSRAKAEMYGNLIQKVIDGKNPREAVTEVIKEKLNTEVKDAIKSETSANRQYAKKGNQRIYSEDGGNTWYDVKTNEVIK